MAFAHALVALLLPLALSPFVHIVFLSVLVVSSLMLVVSPLMLAVLLRGEVLHSQ